MSFENKSLDIICKGCGTSLTLVEDATKLKEKDLLNTRIQKKIYIVKCKSCKATYCRVIKKRIYPVVATEKLKEKAKK